MWPMWRQVKTIYTQIYAGTAEPGGPGGTCPLNNFAAIKIQREGSLEKRLTCFVRGFVFAF